MPVVLEKLTHTYMPGSAMQATAVNDVSLTIHDGEFLGIIGHTGSGKSTLIQHINGLLQPTSGTITVNGLSLADKKSRKEVRKMVGMVFQYPEYQLFEETVEKDIAFGPHNIGVPASELNERVRTAMARVELDYDKYSAKSPFELSGGQKRRVALAGILAMNPSILVLDEPMAGLDPKGRKRILALIKRLHSEGLTIIMVSHSMDDIAMLADRVAVMNAGKLFAVGAVKDVFANPETLMEIGLDVPQAARLAAMLRAKGIDIPADIITPEELGGYIVKRYNNAL